ncbi:MAG: toprim domain-containing protein [Candidatus Bathyarchaeia archaeon]
MNASLRRKFEDIEKTLKRIVSSSRDGIPIIVEGRRDKEALRRLKIPGIVICLKSSGNGFYDFTANLADKREVIVLTDFDKEGTRLAAKLIDELTHMKVKVNVAIWKKLKALCRPEVRAIEELDGLVENLREESRKG